jgi:1-acyl-sn-glycerol-3-phosphate acyltransferase
MIAAGLATVSRFISGASVQWRCDPHSQTQRIYFGNHSSHLDFIVIWSSMPAEIRHVVRPVAGRDYWQQGAIRPYLAGRVFNAVLIDRRDGMDKTPEAARATVQRMAEEMGDRSSLIVFPEGTRSTNGEVGTFKSGLYHLSRLRPDAELVPVYLENLNRILPKGEWLPVPMLIRVIFGPPLPAATINKAQNDGQNDEQNRCAFLARARAALIELRST